MVCRESQAYIVFFWTSKFSLKWNSLPTRRSIKLIPIPEEQNNNKITAIQISSCLFQTFCPQFFVIFSRENKYEFSFIGQSFAA